MKNLRLPAILILFIILLISCQKQETEIAAKIKGYSHLYEKGSKAGSPEEQLAIYNKGLKSVDINDTIFPYLLDGKIRALINLKKHDSAIFYSDSLLNLSSKNNNHEFQTLAYLNKSEIYHNLDEPIKWFENAFKAKNLALQLEDSRKIGLSLVHMAAAQNLISDFRSSQELATQSLDLLDAQKDSIYISGAYDLIARSYRFLGFPEDALREYENSIKFAACDSLCLVTAKNNMALTMMANGQKEESINLLEEVTEETKDPYLKLFFEDNLIFSRWQMNKDLNIEPKLLDNLAKRKQKNDMMGLISSYHHLLIFYEKKDETQAQEIAKKLLETAEKYGRTNIQLTALEALIRYSSPKAAQQYSNKYVSLRDSIESNKLRMQNAFAKIQYDEEQKLKEIDALETQAELKNEEAKHLKNQQIILLLILLILAGITGFYFYFQKQKHQKEKLREIYQTEIRLSKTIHDELANDLYNVMSRLQPTISASEVDKLENIYKKTRDISRKNNSVDTGNFFSENLINMVSENTPGSTRLFIKGNQNIDWSKFSEEQKIVIFRVLQELFINLQKHSEASNVALSFEQNKSSLEIRYSDNGKGFNPETKKSKNGIQNVENRIFSIGGNVTFDSEPGKGLKVDISIPA